ncbi:uncharacterized protein JCM6883_007117 [Sporobolomyces salmoneus]|uniref:uncharacterized protein n=1 Tax=Sporobolomyces salmoneus TaxID=183962 RepID=UPI003176494D
MIALWNQEFPEDPRAPAGITLPLPFSPPPLALPSLPLNHAYQALYNTPEDQQPPTLDSLTTSFPVETPQVRPFDPSLSSSTPFPSLPSSTTHYLTLPDSPSLNTLPFFDAHPANTLSSASQAPHYDPDHPLLLQPPVLPLPYSQDLSYLPPHTSIPDPFHSLSFDWDPQLYPAYDSADAAHVDYPPEDNSFAFSHALREEENDLEMLTELEEIERITRKLLTEQELEVENEKFEANQELLEWTSDERGGKETEGREIVVEIAGGEKRRVKRKGDGEEGEKRRDKKRRKNGGGDFEEQPTLDTIKTRFFAELEKTRLVHGFFWSFGDDPGLTRLAHFERVVAGLGKDELELTEPGSLGRWMKRAFGGLNEGEDGKPLFAPLSSEVVAALEMISVCSRRRKGLKIIEDEGKMEERRQLVNLLITRRWRGESKGESTEIEGVANSRIPPPAFVNEVDTSLFDDLDDLDPVFEQLRVTIASQSTRTDGGIFQVKQVLLLQCALPGATAGLHEPEANGRGPTERMVRVYGDELRKRGLVSGEEFLILEAFLKHCAGGSIRAAHVLLNLRIPPKGVTISPSPELLEVSARLHKVAFQLLAHHYRIFIKTVFASSEAAHAIMGLPDESGCPCHEAPLHESSYWGYDVLVATTRHLKFAHFSGTLTQSALLLLYSLFATQLNDDHSSDENSSDANPTQSDNSQIDAQRLKRFFEGIQMGFIGKSNEETTFGRMLERIGMQEDEARGTAVYKVWQWLKRNGKYWVPKKSGQADALDRLEKWKGSSRSLL